MRDDPAKSVGLVADAGRQRHNGADIPGCQRLARLHQWAIRIADIRYLEGGEPTGDDGWLDRWPRRTRRDCGSAYLGNLWTMG
ncbi:hypothetical protein U3938_09775 [Escherichia coli]|uniref:hypothetical protein n=1 Tax=Escherichia coli TaxID=562 RepID=UPI002D797451|nr:hypothetical protein [Escherichia coli]WRQ37949.1 hypothetical protein U3938_09775 [Escherichia coli]